jgi:SAM-dependent methyltransferase
MNPPSCLLLTFCLSEWPFQEVSLPYNQDNQVGNWSLFRFSTVSSFEELSMKLAFPGVRVFTEPLAQTVLDINEKNRSNLFAWRGQFSPQLVESILKAYCPPHASVLDPFCGSGTVIHEAALQHLPVYGFELNPAGWILSRVYQYINKSLEQRSTVLEAVLEKLSLVYPSYDLFGQHDNPNMGLAEFSEAASDILSAATDDERIIFEAMIVLLDVDTKDISVKSLYDCYYRLARLVRLLPQSSLPVSAKLADARRLPLEADSIDFVITSPPYINVFNYHQNYRRSVEILGWNLLAVARSEIGSNRANRSNRFLTVVQYCLDMAVVLNELCRVCRDGAKVILVVGHESNVLGVPFYNADILERLAQETNTFTLVQRQHRRFTNRFGKQIREDLLHLLPRSDGLKGAEIGAVARKIAKSALTKGLAVAHERDHNAR